MHFRLRYITKPFEFGDEKVRVSDPVGRMDVLIANRSSEDKHPPFEKNQGNATATCVREIPARHHDEAVSSGTLSIRKKSVSEVHADMHNLILHTLRLARWRSSSPEAGPNPIQWSVDFCWSLDGVEWKEVADNRKLKLEFSRVVKWAGETEEFVKAEVLGELDEPIGHELLREALVNRKVNPRSSLIMAVVAAEVGFKQFASKALPDTDWILEKLPSPPLVGMLKAFPWPKLGVLIGNKVPAIPASLADELDKTVTLRNQVVHLGRPVRLKDETVQSSLTAVRDLLYFLDGLQGQRWAFEQMSYDTRKSLT
jgi:hypothetical protein